MSKNFKHLYYLAKSHWRHIGIWFCKCLHAFDNQTQKGTDTVACRANFATVTASPLLHAGKGSRSQQKGYR